MLLTGEGLSTEQDRQQEADRLGSLSDQVKAGELPSNVSPEELQELKAMQLPGMDLLELISGQDSNEEVRLEEILGQGGGQVLAQESIGTSRLFHSSEVPCRGIICFSIEGIASGLPLDRSNRFLIPVMWQPSSQGRADFERAQGAECENSGCVRSEE